MDIRQLKYFLAIADCGGITAASKVLNISEPPLSKQLKNLEDELNTKLFLRKKGTMKLTREGRLLYQHAKALNADFDNIARIFQEIHHGIAGTLRIGCINSAAIIFLPEFMKKYLADRPKINLHMHEENSSSLCALLDSGKIELAIVKEPFDHSLYDSIAIDALMCEEKDYLIAAALPDVFPLPDDQLPFADLKKYPLITQYIHAPVIKKNCQEKGFYPRIICSNNSVESCLSWAMAGLGVCIIPKSTLRLKMRFPELVNLKSVPLTDPLLESGTALIWRRDHLLSAIASDFQDAIRQACEQAEKEMEGEG
ncbi:MAG: LysR family transcriptional regulator [Lachnospiraceae bacterium]|nr:LysR family transcriptional regulator [Lachnospiraceae bacterium]